MNKDQVKGQVEEAKGKAKEAVGVMLDDDVMEAECWETAFHALVMTIGSN